MSSSDIEIETIRRSGSLQNARLPSTSNLNDSYSFKSLAENSYASNDSYSYNARDGLRDTSAGSAGGSYSRQQTDTLIIGSSDCSDDEVQVLGPPKMNGKDR